MDECALCAAPGGEVVWQDGSCRVVLPGDEDGREFPGLLRVIWTRHVAEMSDLAPGERRHLMNIVFAAELALREILQPDKINLASLGNVVTHLHWHVIPRWRSDSRFPAPIWGTRLRAGKVPEAPSATALAETLQQALAGMQSE